MNNRLPSSNWHWVRLGDVCEITIGRTPERGNPKYWNGELPWASISDLNDGIVIDTKEKITKLGADESRARLVPAGTLLFSFKLTIGKMAIAGIDLYTNEAIAALRPKQQNEVDRDFLKYALSVINPGEDASHAVKGKTLNLQTLSTLEIPLPPLPEQQRIAAIVAEQMAAVEQARAAAQAQLEAAEALSAAYLREVFESEEARGWEVRPLLEICEGKGQYGLSLKSSSQPVGVPILGMGNIRDGSIVWGNLKHISLPDEDAAKYLLRAGDILFNRTNSAELVGKTAVFDGSRDAVFASYLIRFRLLRDVADPVYVSAYINSSYGRRFVEINMARAIGQVNISASTMHGMPIPVPPLSEQQNIATMLTEQTRVAANAYAALQQRLDLINRLPAAILRQAFSGEY